MTVKIIIATDSDASSRRWRDAFEGCGLDAEFFAWSRDAHPVQADYAVVWRPSADLFEREDRLKAVFNLGAGVDGVMRLPNLPPRLPVVRIEDAGMASQMIEYTLHGLLRASREFARYDEFQRAGEWAVLPSFRRDQWPVGIMGMGTIGTEIARAVARLGYAVAGWSRSPRALDGIESFAGARQLPAFLARTRVLVNVLPLTADTENILDRKTLGQLLPDAYLINIARGEHVVDDDLVEMLDAGRLRGAMLDVFRAEPLPGDHAFWRHPKVTITPHVAAINSKPETVAQIAGKIRAMQKNQPVSGVVSRALGY